MDEQSRYIAIGVWALLDGWQQEALAGADRLFEAARASEGFSDAGAYQSVSRERMVVWLEADSRSQLERILVSPRTHAIVREVKRVATPHLHIYRQIRHVMPPKP